MPFQISHSDPLAILRNPMALAFPGPLAAGSTPVVRKNCVGHKFAASTFE
jgi:hypothetical protein